MNKFSGVIVYLVLIISLILPSFSYAVGTGGPGLEIYQKFIMGQTKCADLKDTDFNAVGDYVLTQMPEAQRGAMDVYVKQYKGTMSDADFTTLMGKYFTACQIPGVEVGQGMTAGKVNIPDYSGVYSGYLGMMGIIGWFMSLISFVFGLIVLYIIVRVVLRLTRGKKEICDDSQNNKSPVDILKERYAKGELSKEEFEEHKKELLK
ncbi:MAG: SHOCT domain-containing protein [bacterium]